MLASVTKAIYRLLVLFSITMSAVKKVQTSSSFFGFLTEQQRMNNRAQLLPSTIGI